MELDKIEKLLEKYFEATTTVEEEEALKRYFSQEKVEAHLGHYTPMFRYFSKAKEERFTKQVPLAQKGDGSSKNLYRWLSVAAAALLMLGIYFGKSYQDEQQLQRQQAEYAYNETKKALDMLAQNFGRGTEKVAYLNEFVEAKQKIYNKN